MRAFSTFETSPYSTCPPVHKLCAVSASEFTPALLRVCAQAFAQARIALQ
jgi:hypothetical protein